MYACRGWVGDSQRVDASTKATWRESVSYANWATPPGPYRPVPKPPLRFSTAAELCRQ